MTGVITTPSGVVSTEQPVVLLGPEGEAGMVAGNVSDFLSPTASAR